MASSLPNVKSLLHQASNGDEKALKHLGIYRGFTYECPTRFNPSKTTEQELQQQLTDTIFFAESANRLHLDSAEQVARTAMEHIIPTYFGQFGHLPDMNMVLSGRDLAKQLFEDVSELTGATHILHRFDQEDAEVPAEDPNEKMVSNLVRNIIPKALPLKAAPHQKMSLRLQGSARFHHLSRLPQRRRRLPPLKTRQRAQYDHIIGNTAALCRIAPFTAMTFVATCRFMYENVRSTKMKWRRCSPSFVLARSSVAMCRRGEAENRRRESRRSGAQYLVATNSF